MECSCPVHRRNCVVSVVVTGEGPLELGDEPPTPRDPILGDACFEVPSFFGAERRHRKRDSRNDAHSDVVDVRLRHRESLAKPIDRDSETFREPDNRFPAGFLTQRRSVAEQLLDFARIGTNAFWIGYQSRFRAHDLENFLGQPADMDRSAAPGIERAANVPSCVPTAMNASTVLLTNVKSRLGDKEPRWTSSAPASTWLTIVGITARNDWRGP